MSETATLWTLLGVVLVWTVLGVLMAREEIADVWRCHRARVDRKAK